MRDSNKRRQLFQWIENKPHSVIFLQNTHSTKEVEPQWKKEWDQNCIFNHGKNNSRGVCVLIKATVQHTIHSTVMNQEGGFMILEIEVHDVRMTLANVYAPTLDDPHFFQHLINEIECIPNDNRIIGEDFYLVLNIEKDKCGRKTETHKRSSEMIKAWMEETELDDIWRQKKHEKLLFTRRGKRPNLVFSRIYIFWSQLDLWVWANPQLYLDTVQTTLLKN